jgi:two-component system response regulator LytT
MVALPTGTQRLLLWEIYYIEVQGHKLTYHTEKGQLPGTGTLQDAEQRLHGKGFLRCNKCYLVNQKHIQTVTGSDVVLSNGEKLQISRLRKKEFMEELARSMGNEFVL